MPLNNTWTQPSPLRTCRTPAIPRSSTSTTKQKPAQPGAGSHEATLRWVSSKLHADSLPQLCWPYLQTDSSYQPSQEKTTLLIPLTRVQRRPQHLLLRYLARHSLPFEFHSVPSMYVLVRRKLEAPHPPQPASAGDQSTKQTPGHLFR